MPILEGTGSTLLCSRFDYSKPISTRAKSVNSEDLGTPARIFIGRRCLDSIKERGNIAGAVQHANDFYSVGDGAIKNNVVAGGQAAKSRGKVGSFASQFRQAGQRLAFFVNEVQPVVGGGWIFFSDMQGGFNKIEMRPAGAQDRWHQLPLWFRR